MCIYAHKQTHTVFEWNKQCICTPWIAFSQLGWCTFGWKGVVSVPLYNFPICSSLPKHRPCLCECFTAQQVHSLSLPPSKPSSISSSFSLSVSVSREREVCISEWESSDRKCVFIVCEKREEDQMDVCHLIVFATVFQQGIHIHTHTHTEGMRGV